MILFVFPLNTRRLPHLAITSYSRQEEEVRKATASKSFPLIRESGGFCICLIGQNWPHGHLWLQGMLGNWVFGFSNLYNGGKQRMVDVG